MRKLPILLFLLLLLIPIFRPAPSGAANSSPIFENIYLRIAPSKTDGVIDLYYKDKNGNWKIFNSITPIIKVGEETQSAQNSKVSFTSEQLTDGLSSRPDLTRVKIQFNPFPNGAHIYLLMDLEQGKPYVKFSAFKNTGSAEISGLAIGMVGGLTQLVTEIKVDSTTYQVSKCSTYSPGCSDIRTVADNSEFTLNKPDNKIVTLIGETGVKQLMFFDQDFATSDRLITTVNTKGASQTTSSASTSAQRQEVPWFGNTYLWRSPFNGDTNSWYFGFDVDSASSTKKEAAKEKRNLSFRVKFSGIEKNVGGKTALITIKSGTTKVIEKKVILVGTGSGVYVGTLENIPGNKSLQVFIKGPKHLTSRFTLPVGIESVDWTQVPIKGGDVNGDDRVDSSDFAYLQRDYLQNITSDADFNYDTRVDSQDFGIMQTSYGIKPVLP